MEKKTRKTVCCPYCGSGNYAEYVWGMPYMSDELRREMEEGKIVLGGCCITGEDPAYHCRDCGGDFGSPPVRWMEEDWESGRKGRLPDRVSSVEFVSGGYFGGYESVKIVRNGETCTVYVGHSYKPGEPFTREIPLKEWKSLMNSLFNRLFVHEWGTSYNDPYVLDGHQWSLEFISVQGKEHVISGSNAYPPLYKKLERKFKKYISQSRLTPLEPEFKRGGSRKDPSASRNADETDKRN